MLYLKMKQFDFLILRFFIGFYLFSNIDSNVGELNVTAIYTITNYWLLKPLLTDNKCIKFVNAKSLSYKRVCKKCS